MRIMRSLPDTTISDLGKITIGSLNPIFVFVFFIILLLCFILSDAHEQLLLLMSTLYERFLLDLEYFIFA